MLAAEEKLQNQYIYIYIVFSERCQLSLASSSELCVFIWPTIMKSIHHKRLLQCRFISSFLIFQYSSHRFCFY